MLDQRGRDLKADMTEFNPGIGNMRVICRLGDLDLPAPSNFQDIPSRPKKVVAPL
jgi:hypothetical protein